MTVRLAVFSLFLGLFTSCSVPRKSNIVRLQPDDRKTRLSIVAGLSTTDAGVEEMVNSIVSECFPDVELEWETADWGTGFAPLLQSHLSAGEVPDIIIGKAQDVAVYAATGCLAPIPTAVVEQIKPEVLASVSIDGLVYGAVLNVMYQGVLYNKNIFYRYGLEVPRTIAELEEIVRILEQVGITPFASHFQENWYTANILMQFALNDVFLSQPDWGKRFFQGEVSYTASSEMQQCLQNAAYIYTHSFSDSFVLTQRESDHRFIAEKAAMYLTGSWTMQEISSVAPYMEIGLFPYPNREGNARLIFEPNLTLMKSSLSQHGDIIDDLFTVLFGNQSFAETIYAFTQTASVLKAVPAKYPAIISSDIHRYMEDGMILSAARGNSQLVWAVQDEVARHTVLWLQGKEDFAQLLLSCDDARQYSN